MDIKYFVCLNLGVSFGLENMVNCSLGVSMYNNESIEAFLMVIGLQMGFVKLSLYNST
jgi:hypothetical protein